MSNDASTAGDSHEFPLTPFRWLALGLAAIAIFSTYYESDVIGELADLLGRQRGFTQTQIGDLNAAMHLPSVGLALLGGLLIDRFGAARMAAWMAMVGVAGAVLTAAGGPYEVMLTGRFLFGVCEGTIFIALIAALALWFPRSGIALATSLFLSLARVGSFMVNRSTIWAKPLYDAGWQPPLWLGAAITAGGCIAAVALVVIDGRRTSVTAAEQGHRLPKLSELLQFDASFWYILGLHVLYASVFFPFRQTYAVEYLQHAKHLSLQAAASVNSGVFGAAIFATPFFGVIADRFGHRAAFLCLGTVLLPVTLAVLALTNLNPWVSTVLMGVSWSLVPAIIWPSTTLIVKPARIGTALGVITSIQALGISASNHIAGLLASHAQAGSAHPEGYNAMLLFFGLVSLLALTSVVLLWRRESSPKGHGLELAGTAGVGRH